MARTSVWISKSGLWVRVAAPRTRLKRKTATPGFASVQAALRSTKPHFEISGFPDFAVSPAMSITVWILRNASSVIFLHLLSVNRNHVAMHKISVFPQLFGTLSVSARVRPLRPSHSPDRRIERITFEQMNRDCPDSIIGNARFCGIHAMLRPSRPAGALPSLRHAVAASTSRYYYEISPW